MMTILNLGEPGLWYCACSLVYMACLTMSGLHKGYPKARHTGRLIAAQMVSFKSKKKNRRSKTSKDQRQKLSKLWTRNNARNQEPKPETHDSKVEQEDTETKKQNRWPDKDRGEDKDINTQGEINRQDAGEHRTSGKIDKGRNKKWSMKHEDRALK